MIKNIANKINSKTSSLCLIDEPLKKHTTYGIGGPAELMIFPKNKKDLINAIQIINDNKMELTILKQAFGLDLTQLIASLKINDLTSSSVFALNSSGMQLASIPLLIASTLDCLIK